MENLKKIEYRGFWIEFRAMLSNEPSYFSLKRWERAMAFIGALSAQLGYIWMNIYNLGPFELLALVTPLFVVAGYVLNSTQKEKKSENIQS